MKLWNIIVVPLLNSPFLHFSDSMLGTHMRLHPEYILALPNAPFSYIYMGQKVNYRSTALLEKYLKECIIGCIGVFDRLL